MLLNINVMVTESSKIAATTSGGGKCCRKVKKEWRKVQLEKKTLVAVLAEKNMNISAKNAEIAKLQETLRVVEASRDAAKRHLGTYLSTKQVNSVLSGKPVQHWEDEDICNALSLKSLSRKAYKFVRNKWNIPLPSISTIDRRSSRLNVEPGILLSVLNLLKEEATSMTARDRVSVLSFDECSIVNEWSYDKATDHLYGPKKHVQCAMLRGLAASWRQVIFYDFDCPMKKDLLLDLINHAESAGFPVVGIVSDMGPTNIGLWKSLNISTDETSFTNPADSNRKVHVFADVPHLLKLVRNHFLDHGFETHDGKIINSSCVKELIHRSKSDLKVTHRLSETHLEVKGSQRMNVRLAAQLLSNTTAQALSLFGKAGLLQAETWSATSHFILLVDTWFDLLNSRQLYDKKPSRSAFEASDRQKDVLQQMIHTISHLHVSSRRHLLMFQKGIIITSKSLLNLFDMVKVKYDFRFLCTRKLNQDVVEHLFAYIRQVNGPYDHPSPVSVKHRIKSYLLCKDSSLMGEKYNCLEECKENSLTSGRLTTSNLDQVPHGSAEDALQQELCLSSLFLIASTEDTEQENMMKEEMELASTLEAVTEIEGMQYFGGYIAKKFPQYQLGSKVQRCEGRDWLQSISREPNKLFQPCSDFKGKLSLMGKLYECYHGKDSLIPGKNANRKVTQYMQQHVDLPEEVIAFYVRCRTFFRIRILNKKLRRASMQTKINAKMYKLVT